MGMNVPDRNAGFAAHQDQVWGFDTRTGIDSKTYGSPGAKIFYVDPNNAQATDVGNLGEDPTVPLATVDAAVTLSRAYMGDTIVLGSNDSWQHAAGVRNTRIVESLVIPYDKGGLRIVGYATTPLACIWSPAANSEAAITTYAADTLIEGIAFYSDTITNGIGVAAYWNSTVSHYADNLTVRRCFFSDVLDYGIQLDFSYYTQIYDNEFDVVDVAAIHNLSLAGDPDFCYIRGNIFRNCALAVNLLDSSACVVHGNWIIGDGTGTNNMINLTGGADNLVSDNYLACTIAQYDTTCSDATSGAWVHNHCTDGAPVLPPT